MLITADQDVDELGKLEKESPAQANRIKKLRLSVHERQLTANVVLLFKKLRKDGAIILNRATAIYAAAAICTVLTPILIGLMHDEDFGKANRGS